MSASIVRNPHRTEPAWLDDDHPARRAPTSAASARILAGIPGLCTREAAARLRARWCVSPRTWPTRRVWPPGVHARAGRPGQGTGPVGPGRTRAGARRCRRSGQEKGVREDRHLRRQPTSRLVGAPGRDQDFRNFVGSVDFPTFVGGLIQNVFQAIVDASIQQMEAYAELLKSVAQTVDQFAADNITMNNARDWMSTGSLAISPSTPRRGKRPAPKREERGRSRGGVDARQSGIAAGRAGHRSVGCRTGKPAGDGGADADGTQPPADAVVDGDARDQPHRRHRRR